MLPANSNVVERCVPTHEVLKTSHACVASEGLGHAGIPAVNHGETRKMANKKSGSSASPALMKPVKPDALLAKIVGAEPMPRSEITKKLWDYIKRKGLQDKNNKRMINSDEALRPIFGGKGQVSMFEMTKLVNQHMA